MRKLIAIIGPPGRWRPLCREYGQLAEFICVSPVRSVPKDDADFSLFLVDLFSGRYDVMVATCSTVIEAMVGMAKSRKMLERLKEATRKVELVTIGEMTSSCARRHDLAVSSQSPEPTTGSLVDHLNQGGRRGALALLRSDQGSPQMVKDLQSSGWEVVDVPVYTLLLDESEEMAELLDRLDDGQLDALVFPTPAHAQAFMLQLEERDGKENALTLLEGVTVAAMGRETREWLEGYGVKVTVVPERADAKRLLCALMDQLQV